MKNSNLKNFLRLNKHKLRFQFTRISIFFLIMVGGFLMISLLRDYSPDFVLLCTIILSAGIAFPAFTVTLGYLAWWGKSKAIEKAYFQINWNETHLNRNVTLQINTESKWSYTEELKCLNINGFNLVFDVAEENYNILEIQAQVAWRKLGNSEYKRISKALKTQKAELQIAKIVKSYRVKNLKNISHSQFIQELVGFTDLIHSEGFTQDS